MLIILFFSILFLFNIDVVKTAHNEVFYGFSKVSDKA